EDTSDVGAITRNNFPQQLGIQTLPGDLKDAADVDHILRATREQFHPDQILRTDYVYRGSKEGRRHATVDCIWIHMSDPQQKINAVLVLVFNTDGLPYRIPDIP